MNYMDRVTICLTHGVGDDGDWLVAVRSWGEVVQQVCQGRWEGAVVFRTDKDKGFSFCNLIV